MDVLMNPVLNWWKRMMQALLLWLLGGFVMALVTWAFGLAGGVLGTFFGLPMAVDSLASYLGFVANLTMLTLTYLALRDRYTAAALLHKDDVGLDAWAAYFLSCLLDGLLLAVTSALASAIVWFAGGVMGVFLGWYSLGMMVDLGGFLSYLGTFFGLGVVFIGWRRLTA